MSSEIPDQVKRLRSFLRNDLDVREIGLPISTMQLLEERLSQASVAAVDGLREISVSAPKLSLLGKIARSLLSLGRVRHLRRPKSEQLQPLDGDDWRGRLDSLLAQLLVRVTMTTDFPEWIAEKELETIDSILRNCKLIILESRASQAAFPFAVQAASDELIVVVGELAKHPKTRHSSQREIPDRITVAMYVDADDDAINQVITRADRLVEVLGYGEPTDEHIERGSIFRRYVASVRKEYSSRDIRDRRVKAEEALEHLTDDTHGAVIDGEVALAVSGLVSSFSEVSSACIRVGPILFVKYTNGSDPIILVRTLSQIEINAFEQSPEIQSDPVKVFQALALAINEIDGLPNGTS